MLYEPYRQHLTRIVKDLLAWDVLNPAGGAVSVRLPDGNVLMSCTRLAFDRWKVSLRDFIVLAPNGDIIEQTGGLGASGTPMHLDLYRMLPRAGAIVHAHSPYTLAFASLGIPVPSVTNRADAFGEIPCLHADDSTVKARFQAEPVPLALLQGMVQRPDVAAVNLLEYRPQLEEVIAPRAGEMDRHGLAFTLYRHGGFTVGRHLEETLDLMLRLEETARTSLLQAQLTGGTVFPNRLYRPEQQSPVGATNATPVSSYLTGRD
ncbi:class II aldolase/adducin family protein [Streptomyces violaceoruber]|uniref:class II aldolase/adducin family protein n=1 Tax=Streptomyces violaceoruber group TaxID=2867121 RepID=UPI002243EA87|nr:class II aldolase/adducin family protein [Streptomyces anthocyanicus]MCW8122492.1 class II aldolase/adducin family protein [Streptomyces anthocyanicus]